MSAFRLGRGLVRRRVVPGFVGVAARSGSLETGSRSALHQQRDEVAHRSGDLGLGKPHGGLYDSGVQLGEPALEALLDLCHRSRLVCWVHPHRIGGTTSLAQP
ncbi:MAG TPA: hypothetical protein VFN34_02565 [Ornithinibacter sp.]|nr:hypothetical protein [Ornithinibacter sp.]